MVAVFVDLDNPRMLDPGDGAGLDGESSDLVGRGVRPARIILSATTRSNRTCLAL